VTVTAMYSDLGGIFACIIAVYLAIGAAIGAAIVLVLQWVF